MEVIVQKEIEEENSFYKRVKRNRIYVFFV